MPAIWVCHFFPASTSIGMVIHMIWDLQKPSFYMDCACFFFVDFFMMICLYIFVYLYLLYFRYSLLVADERRKAHNIWSHKWEGFLDNILSDYYLATPNCNKNHCYDEIWFDLIYISQVCGTYVHIYDTFMCLSLQWRHHECDGVSSHRWLRCLLNRLFRHRSKKQQSSVSLAFVRGIHRWPVNS